MSFVAVILTFFLIVNALLLILLVLVQLPKKDAGAGLAFGGGTADALFGAGSGNALTKITKWGTGVFLVLCLLLSYLQSSAHNQNGAAEFTKKVQQKQMQGGGAPMGAAPSALPPVNNSTMPAAVSNAPTMLVDTNASK